MDNILIARIKEFALEEDICLEVRDIEEKDFEGLLCLVLEIYDEIPEALSFKDRPDAESFGSVFANKLAAMKEKASIDLIVEDAGVIVGNCEIVKMGKHSGILGILIGRELRNRGIGSMILKKTCEDAASIGVRRIYANVSLRNYGMIRFLENNGWKAEKPMRAEGQNERTVTLQVALNADGSGEDVEYSAV